ncbi:P-loop containing nucleoside triphosphate hydrolase protein [Meredithblackwellia eburnea MCA 4105]
MSSSPEGSSFPVKRERQLNSNIINSDEENRGPRAKKRIRKNEQQHLQQLQHHHQQQMEMEMEHEEEQEMEQEQEQEMEDFPQLIERPPLVRDTKGYVTGSIVRIAAKSFLTYDRVEFSPGPHLNMVLGPNGTGKSTIACAIAIGLGFPPKVLARAEKLHEFVKTGHDEGWVEIELKGPPGNRNTIVKRDIYRDSDQTRFSLNGKSATQKEVSAKMEELNVQVGNLCTFLPQDRVSSFAQMPPNQLLKETQKAAGDTRLTQWHQTLIEERAFQIEYHKSLTTNQEELRRRVEKQAETERDVKAFEQRRDLERDIAVLNVLVPIAEYNLARDIHSQAKARRNDVKAEYEVLQQEQEPFLEDYRNLNEMHKYWDQLKKGVTSKATKNQKEASNKAKAVENCSSEVEKTRRQVQELKSEESNRKKTIDKLENDIRHLEARVANKPAPPDYSAIQQRMQEVTAQRARAHAEVEEFVDIGNKCIADLKTLNHDQDTLRKKIAGLLDVQKQKEANCEKFDSDTMKAVRWMREQKQQGKFDGEVWEPARLTVAPKDRKLVDLAETPITKAQFRTFIFEKRKDYDFMMKALNDDGINGQKLRINGAEIRSTTRRPNRFSDAQLEEWGLDCHAIDLIEGPEAVLSYLCDNANLHQVPVSLGKRQVNQQALENCDLVQRYLTLEGSHSVKRSRYGNRGTLVEFRGLEKAKIMGGNVETEKINQFQQEVAQLETQKDEVGAKHRAAVADDAAGRERMIALDEEKKRLNEQRAAMKKPLEEWSKQQAALDAKKNSLAFERKRPPIDKTRQQLQAKLNTIAMKRVQFALDQQGFLSKYHKYTLQSTELSLRILQTEADLALMSRTKGEQDLIIQDKKNELEEVTAHAAQCHARAKQAQTASLDAMADLDDEINHLVTSRREQEDPVLEQLQEERSGKQAELEVMHDISPAVIQKYNERKEEIAKFRELVDENQKNYDDVTARLDKIKGKWLPKLEALATQVNTKFSAAFERLGLLGEIRIAQDPDYEKWGIEILVSFRDGEPLQVLTAQRQSGGERALTTVMYLMALASLARAPFALVDEINQGMDQRVERNVHNALVATTCDDDVGQYFLITPKLLPNLNYHKKMKVLVIQNGEHLDSKMILQEVVAKRLQRRQRGRHGMPTPSSA